MCYVIFVFPLKFNIHWNPLWLKTKQAWSLVDRPAQKVRFYGRGGAEVDCSCNRSLHLASQWQSLTCIVWWRHISTEREVSAFKDGNFPSKEWANSFMKCHKVTLNPCQKNITHARASMDAEVIDMFFGHLEKELDGILDRTKAFGTMMKQIYRMIQGARKW